MKLVWSDHARNERGDIMTYIAADNPVAALELDELFMERAITLQRFPYIGRPGTLANTRELTVHPYYHLIYEVAEDTVRILNVIHAARNGRSEDAASARGHPIGCHRKPTKPNHWI